MHLCIILFDLFQILPIFPKMGVTHNACISRAVSPYCKLASCGAIDLSPAFTVAAKAAELPARLSTMLPVTAAKWSGPAPPVCNQLVSQCQGHRSWAQVAGRCHCERIVLGVLGVRPAAKTSRQLQSVTSAAADSKTALDSEFPIRFPSTKFASLSVYSLGYQETYAQHVVLSLAHDFGA